MIIVLFPGTIEGTPTFASVKVYAIGRIGIDLFQSFNFEAVVYGVVYYSRYVDRHANL